MRLLRSLGCIAAAFLCSVSWAAPCPDTDYVLRSDTDVNDLAAAGCLEITGDLTIGNPGGVSTVTSLMALNSIFRIGGSLTILGNPSLVKPDGLGGITVIGGGLIIRDTALDTLNGLGGSTTVGGRLIVEGNDDLQDLDGLLAFSGMSTIEIINNAIISNLDGFVGIAGELTGLEIDRNDQLDDVTGLAGITGVTGTLQITGTNNLADLTGLNAVTSVGSLSINNNSSLTDLGPLAGLTAINGNLTISGNDVLSTISALSGVTSNVEIVNVDGNPALASLVGLDNISALGGLAIEDNDLLTSLDGLPAVTSLPGDLIIADNDALEEIDALASIGGYGGIIRLSGNSNLENVDGLIGATDVETLQISDNAVLNDLDGLGNLLHVEQSLLINDNTALTSLEGFTDLGSFGSIGGSLEISGNSQLTALHGSAGGLLGISGLGGFLKISDNDALTSLDGLAYLSSIGSYVEISGNDALTNIDGLVLISDIPGENSGGEGLNLSNNSVLADCKGIAPALGWPDGPPAADNVEYDIAIGGNSTGCNTSAEILASVAGPSQPVITQASVASTSITLEFTESSSTETLFAVSSYTATCSLTGVAGTPLSASGFSSPITITDATRGYDYSCTVAPISPLGAEPASDVYVVSVPLEVPSTPVITDTDYGDGEVILTVSVDDDGGSDITSYEATCTDGTDSVTATGTSSPVTVTGLTNDTAYTCTVTATTSAGTSSASASSDAITPEDLSGLPAWLLYEARP